jgi:hypothetical protein
MVAMGETVLVAKGHPVRGLYVFPHNTYPQKYPYIFYIT